MFRMFLLAVLMAMSTSLILSADEPRPARSEDLVRKLKERREADKLLYSQDDLKAVEVLYQKVVANKDSPDVLMDCADAMIAKYPKANLTGCAVFKTACSCKDADSVKYFKIAIADYGDCFFSGGAQVGPLARFNLAKIYINLKNDEEAAALLEEIKAKYPDAVFFDGKGMAEGIDAQLDRVKPKTGSKEGVSRAKDPQSIRDYRVLQARRRMAEDGKIYSAADLKIIEDLYQVANKKWDESEGRTSLKRLLAKYPRANRAGCAVLYLGEMSRGDKQEKYLQQAIDGFSDCVYGDGVQVGAFARFLLIEICLKGNNTEKAKAAKLIEELKEKYPDSIDHSGQLLVDQIGTQDKRK
jgi:hypothetical protein